MKKAYQSKTPLVKESIQAIEALKKQAVTELLTLSFELSLVVVAQLFE